MLKELKIADITVGSRHRKDMGSLTSLADSIRREGLLQAIGVTEELQLVFGERRLRATRDILKKQTILARIVDVTRSPWLKADATRVNKLPSLPSIAPILSQLPALFGSIQSESGYGSDGVWHLA